MTMKWCAAVLVLLSMSLVGCQSNGVRQPTQKEEATKQWNNARAAVMASMAKNQLEAGNLTQCQQTVRDGLRLNPESADLHLLAAKIAIEQGQLDVADGELTLARGFAPQSAEVQYLIGVVCERWSKNEAALDSYTRACELAPTEVAYVLARTEMLVALDRTPEALEFVHEKSLSFDQSAPLRDALGQLQVGQGNYADAVMTLRQASSMAPDDQLIREHLGMAYFFNKQFREAGSIFEAMMKSEKNANRGELWLALGECQMQLGRAGDARATFDRACQATPSSPRVWTSHAKAAMQLGDTRRAEVSLRKAMSLDSNSSEAHLLLGYLKLRQEKMDEALAEFKRASALDQNDSVSLCMIGYVLEKRGHAEQAIQYYGQALKLKPDDELATKLMASVNVNE